MSYPLQVLIVKTFRGWIWVYTMTLGNWNGPSISVNCLGRVQDVPKGLACWHMKIFGSTAVLVECERWKQCKQFEQCTQYKQYTSSLGKLGTPYV